MYLAWYDASKKLPVDDKITNAAIRYMQKFDAMPTECLLNPADAAKAGHFEVILLRPQDNIAPNCFWVGTPDDNT